MLLHITPSERAALQLLASGKTTHEIAGRLGITESEAEVRLTTLFIRMGAETPTEAVVAAFRRGLLTSTS